MRNKLNKKIKKGAHTQKRKDKYKLLNKLKD